MKHSPADDHEPTSRHETDPGVPPEVDLEAPLTSRGGTPAAGAVDGPAASPRGGALGTIWITLALGALVTIMLLVFILQNLDKVTTHFLGAEFEMPLGVLMLFAAIVGALIMAAAAGGRILQLRMRAHRVRAARQTTR